MPKPDPSRLRKEYLELCEETKELGDVFCARTALRRGTVYVLRRRCGRPNCHCAAGELHSSWVLHDRSERPYCVRCLRPAEIEIFRRMTQAHRRVRKARVRLVGIHKRMLKVVDALTQLRLKQGERRSLREPRRKKKNPKG